MATDLKDRKLLTTLSAGELIAIDAVYHSKCLLSFSNRHRSLQRRSAEKSPQSNLQSLGLAEVVSYIIEYAQIGADMNHVLKVTDPKVLYRQRLQDLGGDSSAHIYSTRLVQKLQQHIPNLEAHNSKSGTVLSFKKDIGDAKLDACQTHTDDEAVMLMGVAKRERKEILETYHFNGSLCDEQYDNLPAYLSALVGMILAGTNPNQNTDDHVEINTAASSITQLLIFNAIKRAKKESRAVSHNADRENVLPSYLGLLIYSKTRKRDIDVLFEKGLSVSYDRISQLSTEEGNQVIDIYENEGINCVSYNFAQ